MIRPAQFHITRARNILGAPCWQVIADGQVLASCSSEARAVFVMDAEKQRRAPRRRRARRTA